MSELRECPNPACNCPNISGTDFGCDRYIVSCDDCYCEVTRETKDAAIAAWNTRAEAVADRLAELVEAVEAVSDNIGCREWDDINCGCWVCKLDSALAAYRQSKGGEG